MPTIATLDGSGVFGTACTIEEQPMANVQQINEFFGINGNQSLFGGTRGRTFYVTGVFIGASPAAIETQKQFMLTYADGYIHTLFDNFGNQWPNVILNNDFKWTGIPRITSATIFGPQWARPYHMTMRGLT